jgi:N,N'-diacetyllegionaminate synthase
MALFQGDGVMTENLQDSKNSIIFDTVRELTEKQNCTIIADVAQSHDGSLGFAHAFIEAVSKTGVNAIKFQTHIADAESTPDEPWRIKFSLQDNTRYDYWKRMEFSEDQWYGLRKHAEDIGLQFLSTPFSMQAFYLLKRIGVAAWKVGSGEMTNLLFLEAMAETDLPIILSTGMSTLAEIDTAVSIIRGHHSNFTVLQCSTAYPCPPEQIGLNMLSFFRNRYACEVGLSDHSGSIYPSLAAVTLGAEMVEVHVTLSRDMFGPDVSSSVTTDELRQLVEGVRYIENILQHPVDKDDNAREKAEMRKIFSKSIVVVSDLPKGTVLKKENLALKKPGTGLGPDMINSLIGRTLKRALQTNQQVTNEDYE